MQHLRFFIALFFLVQALGLSELLHAGSGSCAAESTACAGRADEAEPQADHDAACEWHCLCCATGTLQAERPSALALPASAENKVLEGPFSFVPLAPCANIFHPPA